MNENRRETIQNQDINMKLRVARKRNMWTLSEIADMVGVSPQTYQRWERGTQDPHLSSLRKLCEVFQRDAIDLGFGHLVLEEET
jgi:DNA-binding XRE family transcriptional regulator